MNYFTRFMTVSCAAAALPPWIVVNGAYSRRRKDFSPMISSSLELIILSWLMV